MADRTENMDRLAGIRARLENATPGPWMWDVNSACKCARLVTTHSGMYYVMGFGRWGMQGAAPMFHKFSKYEGPLSGRRSHGLWRADEFLRSRPGKEHHVGYDDGIAHPDAELIEHAPEDIGWLLSEVTRLQAEVGKLQAEIGKKQTN